MKNIKLTLAVVMIMALGISACAASEKKVIEAGGTRLSGAQTTDYITDKTEKWSSGGAYYNPNGTLEVIWKGRSLSGPYTVADDGNVCYKIPGWGKVCHFYMNDNGAIVMIYNGQNSGVQEIENGNQLSDISLASDSKAKVADKYMEAYADFDIKKLKTFYSEDAVFIDPTSEVWGEDAWIMNGKNKIIEKMTSYFSDFDKASATYYVRDKYESAEHTVYAGKVKYSFVTKGALETTCTLITTIISTKDGKVIEHRDYLDYDKLEASLKVGDQDC